MMMRQVKMVSESELGHYELVCWIDNGLARVGKRLYLDDDGLDDRHAHVWVVDELYGTREAKDMNREHGQWRQFWEKLGGG
jgi:hypothetical protein